ncbi:unnamed protein product [Protopolystoma xenopodis]|uniref:Secreted protein n=1 Tax=Protopolystoma xenopodis TaxID=117903 RepID=A0A448WHZ2_9PLAT|nr:unnamed protein product [Protopolystoma xenopodis]
MWFPFPKDHSFVMPLLAAIAAAHGHCMTLHTSHRTHIHAELHACLQTHSYTHASSLLSNLSQLDIYIAFLRLTHFTLSETQCLHPTGVNILWALVRTFCPICLDRLTCPGDLVSTWRITYT